MPDRSCFQALIFDMDGVLVDSEPHYYRAVNMLLAEHGHTLSEEAYRRLVGTTGRSASEWIITHFRLPWSYEDWQARYHEAVLQLLAGPLEPLPGARALIAAARSYGLRLGLASASPAAWIAAILRSLGLDEAFDTIVSGTQVERGKPAPDIFLLTAARLSVPAVACIAIEDSEPGVQAARAAGMFTVQLRATSYAAPPLPQADLVLTSLAEFPRALFEGARLRCRESQGDSS